MIDSTRQLRTQWFSELSNRFRVHQDPVMNLMVDFTIEESWRNTLGNAVKDYIRACLGHPSNLHSEKDLLESAGANLANRTNSGVLIPKQEFQLEYNQLHKTVVSWFQSLGVDDLIYQMFNPLIVRLIRGHASPEDPTKPYANTKLHADIWNNEPFDLVNIMIPLLGDTDNTSTEVYHPPDDFEERFLIRMDDFDEGKELEGRCLMYPGFERGHAYFLDAILPHRTVRGDGSTRVTLSTPIRRATTESERRKIEAVCGPGRLGHFVDRDEWYKIGSNKFLKFTDTYADAERGIFNEKPYDSPSYQVVDSL